MVVLHHIGPLLVGRLRYGVVPLAPRSRHSSHTLASLGIVGFSERRSGPPSVAPSSRSRTVSAVSSSRPASSRSRAAASRAPSAPASRQRLSSAERSRSISARNSASSMGMVESFGSTGSKRPWRRGPRCATLTRPGRGGGSSPRRPNQAPRSSCRVSGEPSAWGRPCRVSRTAARSRRSRCGSASGSGSNGRRSSPTPCGSPRDGGPDVSRLGGAVLAPRQAVGQHRVADCPVRPPRDEVPQGLLTLVPATCDEEQKPTLGLEGTFEGSGQGSAAVGDGQARAWTRGRDLVQGRSWEEAMADDGPVHAPRAAGLPHRRAPGAALVTPAVAGRVPLSRSMALSPVEGSVIASGKETTMSTTVRSLPTSRTAAASGEAALASPVRDCRLHSGLELVAIASHARTCCT